MIRMDLLSLFQKTILGIIPLVFRRLNQQFDELEASLDCSTGPKGKLLFWITAVVGSHQALLALWEEWFAAGDEN